MRARAMLIAAVMVAVSVATAVGASPPSGGFSAVEHGRVQINEGGTLPMAPRSRYHWGSYALSPASSTGWRDQAGPAVLSVTAGKLTVTTAGGSCTSKEYPAGQAAFLPAGRYLLATASDQDAKFTGAFFAVVPGTVPLSGDPVTAPAGCTADTPATPSLTVSVEAPGTFVAESTYRGHRHPSGAAKALEVEAGQDIFTSTYIFDPGFRSPRAKHQPAITVVQRGEVTYYEEHDGRCLETEVYKPGDVYFHEPHLHFVANDGTEPAEVVIVYALPHGQSVPIKNQFDAIEFSPVPPSDCLRLN